MRFVKTCLGMVVIVSRFAAQASGIPSGLFEGP